MPVETLSDEQLAFISGGVSITAGSCDRRRVPSVMKAAACRAGEDHHMLTLLVEKTAARQLLQDIAATAAITVVFSQPSTHRTLQIKGGDARIGGESPGDRELIALHSRLFAGELVPLGYSREFALALHAVDAAAELVSITFSVDAVYEQTPGPGAGARIGGGR